MPNDTEVEQEIARLVKLAHPQDQGKPTEILEQELRAALHTSLVAAVEGKKTREMQPGENRAKYIAFQRGEEHMKAKVLTIINSIFKE